MINPFDPKTVFLAKHAQHVVLIHLPLRCASRGVAFDLAAQWNKATEPGRAAYHTLLVQ